MFYKQKTVEVAGVDYAIRCMTGLQELHLMTGLELGQNIPPDRLHTLLQNCLMGWGSNAVTLTGDPLGEFTADKIEWLAAVVIDELSAAIMRLSKPDPELKKTLSESPSSDTTALTSIAKRADV